MPDKNMTWEQLVDWVNQTDSPMVKMYDENIIGVFNHVGNYVCQFLITGAFDAGNANIIHLKPFQMHQIITALTEKA